MHRHGVGLSAEAIVLTTVAVSQRVPTMTVTAAGVVVGVVRATEQRTPTASSTPDSMTEFTIIAACGSWRRVLAPVRGYPTSEGSRP
jgi:hypothetical protein